MFRYCSGLSFLVWSLLSIHCRCRLLLHMFTLSYTLGRNPLDEGSARHRDLYLTAHSIYKRQSSVHPSGIRTRNPSKRAVSDLRLRPRGHRDPLCPYPIHANNGIIGRGAVRKYNRAFINVTNLKCLGPALTDADGTADEIQSVLNSWNACCR